jgi:tetratricopeptide (TPR) repeat protein
MHKQCVYSHPLHIFLILLLAVQFLPAQSSPADQLVAAGALRDRGDYKQALAILEPLAQSAGPDAPDASRAWILLGSIYQDVGRYVDAQRAYQAAISAFKNQPDKEREEAAAMDNLGSLYLDMGQAEMSRQIRLRVLQLAKEAGDHAGLARVYNNLAVTAFQRNQVDEGRKYISQALQEVKQAPQVANDDLAAIYSNAGSLSMYDHDYKQALRYYEHARQVWIKQHGMNHKLTGWGYVLCGRVRALLGDPQQGLVEVTTGLSIIEESVGTRVPLYFAARLAYADVLSATGSTREAKEMRSTTAQSLESFRRATAGFPISADAFR